jgi:NAD(P)H dehydrogenase (quinone)
MTASEASTLAYGHGNVTSGMDGEPASFSVNLDETIAARVFARVGDDLSRLLGRPTTGLVEGLTAE